MQKQDHGLMQRLLPRSFAKQVALLTSLVIVFGTIALTSYLVIEITKRELIDSKQKLSAITETIGLGVTHHLVVHDYAEVELILLHATHYPGMKFIAVVDTSGRVLSAIQSEKGKSAEAIYNIRNMSPPPDKSSHVEWRFGGSQGNPLAFGLDATEITIWHPIENGDLGWLNVTYSVESLHDDALHLIAISLLIALVWIMVMIVVVTRLLQPSLGALGNATNFARSLINIRGQQIPTHTGSMEIEQLGQALNITSQQLFNQDTALRESSENLKRLLDSMAEGAYGIDDKGVCTFVNPAFLGILGYDDADEVVGKLIHTLIHHTRADGSPYPITECKISHTYFEQHQVHIDDEVFWRKDGVAVPVEYWASPIIHEGKTMGTISTFVDITERKASEKEIQLLAYFDPLTHLPNRRLLMDRLQHAVTSSARMGRVGALLLIDLDNFKTLNDTLGHQVGDLLLQQTAQRLESCVRNGDTVARLGGDEFVVMLENLSELALEAATQTETIGEKILAALSQPYQLGKNEHRGAASIGVTLFKDNIQVIDELVKQADIAMYQAKKAGRNTLRFFDQEMQANISARVLMEEELRKALEQRQFQLYYQIQIDSSHRSFGAEALIRWIHPERGLVPPMQFIPLAEETGLILPIGQWVLNTACAQIKAWQQYELTRNLVIAVNVSAKQFRHAEFVTQVQDAVQKHGINPILLKLELTESLMLESIEDTVATMNALNSIGVLLSLDDFGTGYSSLQYLKRLPLDQLKIDQSFVRDIATDSSDKAIVRTIIAMAQSMSLNVIAEGVETEEQRQFLLNNGCTHFQGYLFGRPIPIEQFDDALKRL